MTPGPSEATRIVMRLDEGLVLNMGLFGVRICRWDRSARGAEAIATPARSRPPRLDTSRATRGDQGRGSPKRGTGAVV